MLEANNAPAHPLYTLALLTLTSCSANSTNTPGNTRVIVFGDSQTADVETNYVMPGYAARQRGDLQADIADQTLAIAQAPRFYAAYLERGIAYALQGKNSGAIADFTFIVQTGPNLEKTESIVETAYLLRAVLYQNQGLNPQAENDYQAALKLNPKNARAWYGLGKVTQAMNVPGAGGAFAAAAKLDPDIAAQDH